MYTAFLLPYPLKMKRLNKGCKLMKISVKTNRTKPNPPPKNPIPHNTKANKQKPETTKTPETKPKNTLKNPLLQKMQTTLRDKGEKRKQNIQLVTNYFL